MRKKNEEIFVEQGDNMSTKEIITKDLSHVDIPMLKQYATANQNTIDTAAADKVVDEFQGTEGQVPVSDII